jgi:small-conductance mechanosensitive channel
MVIFLHALFYGLVLSFGLSSLILLTLYINPEMWLHDAPSAVQAQVGPMSARARRQRAFWSVPFFLLLFGVLALSIMRLGAVVGALTFTAVFVNVVVVLMTFNLVDLIIIDWLIVAYWRPQFIMLPGVNPDMWAENEYLFHFKGFLKGSVGIIIASPILAAITMLFV